MDGHGSAGERVPVSVLVLGTTGKRTREGGGEKEEEDEDEEVEEGQNKQQS